MADSTVIKPKPGRLGLMETNVGVVKAPSLSNDRTVVHKNSSKLGVMPLSNNPLVEEASIIFSIIFKVRSAPDNTNVDNLKKYSIDRVKDYEQRLKDNNLSLSDIESARYCLCSFVDETVLNTTWGGRSNWSEESLLSIFHTETFGGEYFYKLLDDALSDPQNNLLLIEFLYMCLSLGFIGKMRIEDNGMDQIETYRYKAFQIIKRMSENTETLISPTYKKNLLIGVKPTRGIPLWVVTAVFAVMTLGIYMGFSYNINSLSDPVFARINNIAQLEQGVVISDSEGNPSVQHLKQLLQSEVSKGFIELIELNDRLRIIINSSELFSSGSAEVKEGILPILAKVARVLESTSGHILITGHTDNQPIFTSKYPSNWHLSLARATAVANILAMGSELQGRLWPEGKGDASPRYPNDSHSQRAENRRVEIDLLFN
ncbi:type VI secretion system protein TssL, long form [Photobacterium atrarenae]|uniref:Type VI secretion system protein TssL, long form n=1 Tax=Photobacterium atrarenae TaxID=865757 RepID=A0ABY5GCG5_9GAMM|nr:type VI secretion system protein TssL, long form [Photobacterium atrarenae]UTV26500.1 type VI secretion system protein TssL, long form [Photobacterium atrarenae]